MRQEGKKQRTELQCVMLIGFVLGRGRSWPYTVIVLGSARISYPQGIMSLPTACLRTVPRDQSEASREHGLPTNGHYHSTTFFGGELPFVFWVFGFGHLGVGL